MKCSRQLVEMHISGLYSHKILIQLVRYGPQESEFSQSHDELLNCLVDQPAFLMSRLANLHLMRLLLKQPKVTQTFQAQPFFSNKKSSCIVQLPISLQSLMRQVVSPVY